MFENERSVDQVKVSEGGKMLSQTHTNGGYSVTVGEDGAILVKPGDSLSKYSMAIHGDFRHVNEYKHRRNKPVGPITDKELQEISNPNLIYGGEVLYHIPTRNLGTCQVPLPQPKTDSGSLVPSGIPEKTLWDRIKDLLHYFSSEDELNNERPATPSVPKHDWSTDWRVTGSAGLSVGIDTELVKIGYVGSGMAFWVQRPSDPSPTRMVGISHGASIGFDFEFGSPVGGSFSLPSFRSNGKIFKGPKAGSVLSKSELRANFIAFEINASAGDGQSAIVIVAHEGPPEFYIQWLNPFWGGAAKMAPVIKWILLNEGDNIGSPDVSTTIHTGIMTVI